MDHNKIAIIVRTFLRMKGEDLTQGWWAQLIYHFSQSMVVLLREKSGTTVCEAEVMVLHELNAYYASIQALRKP